ncbi:MAG: DUF4115 domain-containing protein [Candidatus Contendobacter sp.]|nr:DUF4115 domain-containing protein [Candidatus Contendobacter sp.]MDG4557309.1 DUF4115 domain-containing protein [Candidatus Contendobacter sp.]
MSTRKETAPKSNSPTDAPPESLGAWLARVRAGHGAEPRDMARQLGLNPTLILALEADDFARLGPPVFVRGYLSRYARLLDLPEAAVLERYRQQSSASQDPPPLKVMHSPRRQTRVRDLRGLAYLVVVIALGWTAIQNLDALDPGRLLAWWPPGHSASVQPPAGKPVAGATQTQYPFQSPPAEATRELAPSPAAPATGAPPANPEPAAISTVALAPPPSPPAVSESAPASGVARAVPVPASATLEENGDSSALDARSAGARLMLQFSDDCWVEVKDAQGKVLVNGLMKANTSRELSGPAPFTVTLGNAPAARIALDDRMVDTAIYVPRRGTVSRFTLNSHP